MGRASGRKDLPRAVQPAPDSPEGRGIGLSARQDPAGSPIPGLTGNIVNYETVRREPPTGEQLPEYRGIMAHGVPPEDTPPEERARMMRDGTLAQHQPPTPPVLHAPKAPPLPVPVYITTRNAGGRPLGTISAVLLTIPGNVGNDPVRIAARDHDRTTLLIQVETPAGSLASVSVTPPTVPATGVTVQNTTGYRVQVVISANGATISTVNINGEAVGNGPGTYVIPVDGVIFISYTVATPAWTWTELNVPQTAPSGIRISREISSLSAGAGALVRANSGWLKLDNEQDELFAISNDGSAVTLSALYLYGEPSAD